MGMDKREEKREYIGADAEPDYKELIIDMVGKIGNKKLLKRIYALAEYLYLHEDSE